MRAVLRFFLLVALGFAAGLVIGIVSEEPELLAGHLRGESTSVSLSAQADDAPTGVDAEELSPDVEIAAADPGPTRAQTPTSTSRPPATPTRVRAPEAQPVAVLPAVPARVTTPPARLAARSEYGDVTPPRVSAPPEVQERAVVPRDAFAIQVGAFSDEKAAKGLARGLEQKGYPAAILPSAGSARRFRVRVQPFKDEAAAQAMAGRLKRDEGLPTWVLRMEQGNDSGNGAR